MIIKPFFDPQTFTVSYIVVDDKTSKCAIIDPVLDYDIFSGKISVNCANSLISFIKKNNLEVEWILETHIHADHITASDYLKNNLVNSSYQKTIPKSAIGEGIFSVLKYWVKFFNIENEVPIDGSQFDYIFKDGESFRIGNLDIKFIATPGHTPACGSYLIKDVVFVGDLIFMPNLGTGRTDFPGGSSKEQFVSIQKIFSLPDNVKIFTGHDYPKDVVNPAWESSVLEQKENNIFAKIKTEREYIMARQERDKKLDIPKLLFPSIQVNLRAGKMPKAEDNNISYIKTPITL